MTVFPRLVLVPASTDPATYLLRSFYPQDSDPDAAHPRVAIATGFAVTGGLELQTRAGLTSSAAADLIAQATTHSAQGKRTWDVIEKSGFLRKKPSLLRASGDPRIPAAAMTTEGGGLDDLSSDLILDESFLGEACDLLRTEDLIAAIPKRGWLLVGKAVPGELPMMLKFGQIAQGIASRGGKHALTTSCYFLQGGKLHGVSGPGYIGLLTRRETSWNLPGE